MKRYNHCLIEKRWQERWERGEDVAKNGRPQILTILVPAQDQALNLENARLLVLADLLGIAFWGQRPVLHVPEGGSELAGDALRLGICLGREPLSKYDLCVAARDYKHLAEGFSYAKIFYCGRFFEQSRFDMAISDYGGDALRVFFLSQGPLRRDYRPDPAGLGAGHRFVQNVWRFTQAKAWDERARGAGQLAFLQQEVAAGLKREKPHLALAALMRFLKSKVFLVPEEIKELAEILSPFTPHLGAELLWGNASDREQ